MMQLFKRALALMLVFALMLSFASCSILGIGTDDQNQSDSGEPDNGAGNDQDTNDTEGDQSADPEDKHPDSAYMKDPLPAVPEIIDCAETNGKIKNLILIIGDGMGDAQLDLGELIYGKDFAFRDEFGKFYSNTNSIHDTTGEPTNTTDSAAGATALATGYLTKNSYVGITSDLKKLTTVLDIAKDGGKSTGILTTDVLIGATPAGFSAHTLNRNYEHDIVRSQIRSGIDLLIGQYSKRYVDHKDEVTEVYNYFDSYDRDAILAKKGESSLCNIEIETSEDGAAKLSELALMAIEYLSANEEGYVLVIEQAHIDKRCHSNDALGAAKAANSLNDTVEAIMQLIGDRDDTALIITADHETGGLSVSADPEEYDKKAETVNGGKISYNFEKTSHTTTLVPVYTYGFIAHPEKCTTFNSEEKVKNTDIFHFMVDIIENS